MKNILRNMKIIIDNRIIILFIITTLFSCNNNDIEFIADDKCDTLIINNTEEIPFISTKEEIYELFGEPKKIRYNVPFFLYINDSVVKSNSIHYMWDNYYYIEVNKKLFLNSIFFYKNKDIILVANDSIYLNNKTRLSFIKKFFPDSYNDMYVLSHYFSSYYPDDLKKDLIVVPFETQYGVIELIFYKNKLYYIETRINTF